MSRSVTACLYLTAAGIIAYWGAVFSGVFPVEELGPGYRTWFLSFPVADFWIAATAVVAAVSKRSNRALSVTTTAAAGSGLVFLGTYAFAYGLNTGLVNRLTTDEVIEIAIKIYCVTAGGWLLVAAYRVATGLKLPRETS